MTIDELKKVPFRETCHMAMEGEYTTTYTSNERHVAITNLFPHSSYILHHLWTIKKQ